MKKTTIIALIILLIAGLFVACDNETIVDDEFNPAIEITNETKTLIPGNKYKTVADTKIANRVTIEGKGTVTIILTEGTTLTIEKGVNVTGDQELYIEGTGKLVATGDPKSAGIGGGENEDGGTVVIQGGNITANGGSEGGAGIGGGKGGKSGTTIIQKQGGKEAPEVTTKGGSTTADGIGKGEGATGDPKEIKLDGVGLESSDDGLTWHDYSEEHHYHKQYMRTFVGAIITFNANGGTGEMAAQVVHVNKDENLKANTYTRTGMSFKGWNTKADGTGTAYANKASINVNADITLYAQWETAPAGNYITSTTTSIQSGKTWTIQGDVVNNNKITIDGNEETTIFLPEGKTLEVKLGIAVSVGQTLIIDGDDTGKLIAGEELPEGLGHQGQAGIGGANQDDYGGTIIVKNGTITAYGGYLTAAIGCIVSPETDTPPATGTMNIQILGGIVHAEGGVSGAGIGGYRATILVEEGTVVSKAYQEATVSGVGIGGYGCSITINGGDIQAWGGKCGAGIGSLDNHGPDGISLPQTIKITGGTVEATGGSSDVGVDDRAGAGIGGGEGEPGGKIIISGGIITANGGTCETGAGAGIGGGAHLGAGGTVEISGGTVNATGSYGGAGIGGGKNGDSGSITINGGKIKAIAAYTMANNAIGRGAGSTVPSNITLGPGVSLETSNDWGGTFNDYPKTGDYDAAEQYVVRTKPWT